MALKPVVYRHHTNRAYVILAVLLFVFLLFSVFVSFSAIGFTPLEIVLIAMASFLDADVNIPVATLKSKEPIVGLRQISWFGIDFLVPVYSYEETIVAVNFGGAIVPVFASAYLLITHLKILPQALLAIVVMSVLIHFMAFPVRGVGIVTPFFLPPVLSALLAILIGGGAAPVIAYTSGTLGSLIGADLMNLNRLDRLGASFVSIGGAGVFDGVFLTGLIAALLTL